MSEEGQLFPEEENPSTLKKFSKRGKDQLFSIEVVKH